MEDGPKAPMESDQLSEKDRKMTEIGNEVGKIPLEERFAQIASSEITKQEYEAQVDAAIVSILDPGVSPADREKFLTLLTYDALRPSQAEDTNESLIDEKLKKRAYNLAKADDPNAYARCEQVIEELRSSLAELDAQNPNRALNRKWNGYFGSVFLNIQNAEERYAARQARNEQQRGPFASEIIQNVKDEYGVLSPENRAQMLTYLEQQTSASGYGPVAERILDELRSESKEANTSAA